MERCSRADIILSRVTIYEHTTYRLKEKKRSERAENILVGRCFKRSIYRLKFP